MTTALLWYRRDLRTHDHPALARACAEHRRIIPVYVIDPRLWATAGQTRRAYLAATLAELQHTTGGTLVVRTGNPADVIPALATESGATAVHITGDTTPYACRRDRQVAAVLQTIGIPLIATGTPYVHPAGHIVTGSGTPHRTHASYARTWSRQPTPQPVPTPQPNWVNGPDGETHPVAHTCVLIPAAGELAALHQTKRFAAQQASHYHERRDLPAVDGTSRLSAHLHLGTTHPRTVLTALCGPVDGGGADTPRAEADSGQVTFRDELIWREFYADVAAHQPLWHPHHQQVGAIAVDTDAAAVERFAAWKNGMTGYPLVDAGMRQLAATGWMHNRVRMTTASFLTKHLHLPWQWGTRHFLDQLVDGDVASNNLGWQWIAGTGTDAQPFFRILNPVTQAARFDPAGTYVKTWIPELCDADDRTVLEPWRTSNHRYPRPIIDLATERADALARYEATRR